MSASPIEVEITRGGSVESAHAVDAILLDGAGATVRVWGDPERPMFPRSSVKLIQALPLIEGGAADAYSLSDEALALACSSHDGMPMHTATAEAMLTKAGLDQRTLECGTQPPLSAADRNALLQSGTAPNALHHPCSGKHAGMICCATHAGIDPTGYTQPEHPHQMQIAQLFSELMETPHTAQNRGIDGCSVPTYAVPLSALALGFAKLASGTKVSPSRKAAADRLIAACFAHPGHVAGPKRVDTQIMSALPGRAFAKTGAEGVCIAIFPQDGLALALKCRDGNMRASWATLAAIVRETLARKPGAVPTLDALAAPPITNTNKLVVGATKVLL